MEFSVGLVISAVLFGVFILVRFPPAFSSAARAARVELRGFREKLRKASSTEEKSALYFDAAELCDKTSGLRGRAVRFALKGHAETPEKLSSFERAISIVGKSRRGTEQLCLRTLAASATSPEAKQLSQRATSELANVYSKRRDKRRAHAFRSLSELLKTA